MNSLENRTDLSLFAEKIGAIRTELKKYIVGQEKVVDELIIALIADGHVLIEGVPGLAKTLLARLLAKIVDVKFKRIQFTPDLLPSDIIGTSIFNMQESKFHFNKGPLFSNIILADEINRSPAKTQAALFEAMEEKQITVDGKTHKLNYPFLVLATQNPVDMEGTYRLPEAQIDRFLFKITINYPNLEEEKEILSRHHSRNGNVNIKDVNKILFKKDLDSIKETIGKIQVEDSMLEYIAKIVTKTRNNPDLFLPASPRASLSLLSSSKVFAAINGRDFVTPDDIKFVLSPTLRHRLILSPDKELEGSTVDDVINELIKSVEIPR